jgi:hypothetical protein
MRSSAREEIIVAFEVLKGGMKRALDLRYGWTTRKNARGETEWIPPPHVDRGQPRTNTFLSPPRKTPAGR